MANENIPGGVASSVKVLADAVRDIFGAAIVIESFLGIALVALSIGGSNIDSKQRCEMMYVILGIMVGVLILLMLLRIFKPSGLGGPPTPTTEDITIIDSTFS